MCTKAWIANIVHTILKVIGAFFGKTLWQQAFRNYKENDKIDHEKAAEI